MREIDQLDAFSDGVEGLEKNLSDAAASTATLSGELREVRVGIGETVRDLGNLQNGFSNGLRKAFDGLVLDGMKLSDALNMVATSMVDTVYNNAINPVTDQIGGFLANGLNAVVSGLMPYKDGAPFSQGRVMPFARGGVVSGPTSFPMRGGTGLMGEAGPEAIMPLARGADGKLGVRGGGGGTVNVMMNIQTPDARGFERSQAQIAAQMSRILSRGQRNR
ncbi:MAG: phage tail tape measure protein [Rhodobacterales bacterium]|nr:phage tail tape measure protein [Rhodobacterales bacterium]